MFKHIGATSVCLDCYAIQVSLAMWHHTFNVPGHMVRLQIDEDGIYDLFIDNIPFYRFEKRGADYLRRQAEVSR